MQGPLRLWTTAELPACLPASHPSQPASLSATSSFRQAGAQAGPALHCSTGRQAGMCVGRGCLAGCGEGRRRYCGAACYCRLAPASALQYCMDSGRTGRRCHQVCSTRGMPAIAGSYYHLVPCSSHTHCTSRDAVAAAPADSLSCLRQPFFPPHMQPRSCWVLPAAAFLVVTHTVVCHSPAALQQPLPCGPQSWAEESLAAKAEPPQKNWAYRACKQKGGVPSGLCKGRLQ